MDRKEIRYSSRYFALFQTEFTLGDGMDSALWQHRPLSFFFFRSTFLLAFPVFNQSAFGSLFLASRVRCFVWNKYALFPTIARYIRNETILNDYCPRYWRGAASSLRVRSA